MNSHLLSFEKDATRQQGIGLTKINCCLARELRPSFAGLIGVFAIGSRRGSAAMPPILREVRIKRGERGPLRLIHIKEVQPRFTLDFVKDIADTEGVAP